MCSFSFLVRRRSGDVKAYFQRLFHYSAWADQRSLAALRAAPAAHAEALPLLAHLLAAEHVWLARLEQRAPTHAVWPTLTLDECDALSAANEAGYQAFIGRLGDGRPTGSVCYRTAQGQEFISSVLDILSQVVTHGPYHRGQIAKIIARSGGAVINTDFITFARETEPFLETDSSSGRGATDERS
ncbi:MAG: hypothetical protein C0483_05735 [Pirellula sp.]|nr:hypothetical protein [Pirellula sp.]